MKYFKTHEFDSPDLPGSGEKMNPEFLEKLDKLREACGFPFVITSGYRTEDHNKAVGGEKGSAHLLGRAADIQCNGIQAYMILTLAAKFGFTGIGVKQSGGGRYVHLDDAHVVPVVWTYP